MQYEDSKMIVVRHSDTAEISFLFSRHKNKTQPRNPLYLTLLPVRWQKEIGFGRMDNGCHVHYRMGYRRSYGICRYQC